jgi:precorrin-8X/cobalt-precorrin-8 methylmutase
VESPADIEGKSFEIIERLLPDLHLNAAERAVVIRIVHATGDPSIASQVAFSPGAAEMGIAALREGAPVYCDVNMVRSGVTPSLRRLGLSISCLVEDPRAVSLAASEGLTRSVAAMRVAQEELNGSVVVIGNAPTALLELVRLSREEGTRPALVVGVPVGFVAAAEAKQALVESELAYVTLPGQRGGTPVAVATVNALARLAVPDPSVFRGAPVAGAVSRGDCL